MNRSKHPPGFWYASSERNQPKEEACDYFFACLL